MKLMYLLIGLALFQGGRPLKVASGEPSTDKKFSANTDRFLKWLPANTEAIIVRQTPWTVAADSISMTSFVASHQPYPGSIVSEIRENRLRKLLARQKVLQAVLAARGFASPEQFGRSTFAGAEILLLDSNSKTSPTLLFADLCRDSTRLEKIGDQTIAVYEQIETFAERRRGQDSLYFSLPFPDVVLVATSEGYLSEVLERTGASERVAFPDDLSLWKHVELNAPVWGLRHFRVPGGDQGDTSPLNPAIRAFPGIQDKKAIGVTLAIDIESRRLTCIRVGDGDARAALSWLTMLVDAAEQYPDFDAAITARDDGIIELTGVVPAGGDSTLLFLVMLMMGHATYS